jgi:hypothetical protein
MQTDDLSRQQTPAPNTIIQFGQSQPNDSDRWFRFFDLCIEFAEIARQRATQNQANDTQTDVPNQTILA